MGVTLNPIRSLCSPFSLNEGLMVGHEFLIVLQVQGPELLPMLMAVN